MFPTKKKLKSMLICKDFSFFYFNLIAFYHFIASNGIT